MSYPSQGLDGLAPVHLIGMSRLHRRHTIQGVLRPHRHDPDLHQQALAIAAAAVVAHPFLTKVVNDWGKYPSIRAAREVVKSGPTREQRGKRSRFYARTSSPFARITRSSQGIVEGFEMKGLKTARSFRRDEPNRQLAGAPEVLRTKPQIPSGWHPSTSRR